MRDSERLYAELVDALAPTGFFAAAPPRYHVRLVGLFVIVIALAVLAFTRTWLAAVPLGIACGQLGFYGHDAVHRAVSSHRRVNALVGQLSFSVVNGLGFAYWTRIHVAHHKHLQHEGLDPDLDFPVALSMTPAAAAAKTGMWRTLGRLQAWYFWPSTLLYAHRLRLQGTARILRSPRAHRGDLVGLALHYIGWLVIPSFVWSPGVVLVVYAIASASVGLYLGLVFGVNHVGMRAIAPRERIDFLAQPFECTRNITNPESLDFLFGGLNFHTAHHLFPRVPHACLRRGTGVLRAFSKQKGLTYHETTFPAAVASVTRHLACVAKTATR